MSKLAGDSLRLVNKREKKNKEGRFETDYSGGSKRIAMREKKR